MKFWEAFVRHASQASGQRVTEDEAIAVGREMGMTVEELNAEVSEQVVNQLWSLQMADPMAFAKVIDSAAAEWLARN